MIWIAAAWRAIANSRLVQALALIGSIIGYHLFRTRSAKRAGASEERREAEQRARERAAEHAGDVSDALREIKQEQRERRNRDENTRDRFSRDPFE